MNDISDAGSRARVDALLARLESFPGTQGAIPPAGPAINYSRDGLERTRRLLGELGNPHLDLPATIHVAGTNGKGSVTALMRAMAEKAGLRVHAYISPHLCRFNERIRLQGRLIEDDALAEVLEAAFLRKDGDQITYFELTTAAAFLAFSRSPAELLILETGLGGELDATNVIPQPRASVITPVSLDHQRLLGADLAQIAGAKAGIIKPGVPCFSARQDPQVAQVLEGTAKRHDAPLCIMGRDIPWHETQEGGLVVEIEGAEHSLPKPGLAGRHQIENAALAFGALCSAMPEIDAGRMASGVADARWPGRLERLCEGRLADLFEDREIWLDGAHNSQGAKTLALALEAMRPGGWHFVFGALNSRDPQDFMTEVTSVARSITCVPIASHDACVEAEELLATASRLFERAGMESGVEEALQRIACGDATGGRDGAPVIICGSLDLLGNVLALNGTPPC